jgi:hypothetical protein
MEIRHNTKQKNHFVGLSAQNLTFRRNDKQAMIFGS